MPMFKVGNDRELPSEEEILAFSEKNKAERAAEDDSTGKEDKKHKKDEMSCNV
jgi:hypoxia up-regulated 1